MLRCRDARLVLSGHRWVQFRFDDAVEHSPLKMDPPVQFWYQKWTDGSNLAGGPILTWHCNCIVQYCCLLYYDYLFAPKSWEVNTLPPFAPVPTARHWVQLVQLITAAIDSACKCLRMCKNYHAHQWKTWMSMAVWPFWLLRPHSCNWSHCKMKSKQNCSSKDAKNGNFKCELKLGCTKYVTTMVTKSGTTMVTPVPPLPTTLQVMALKLSPRCSAGSFGQLYDFSCNNYVGMAHTPKPHPDYWILYTPSSFKEVVMHTWMNHHLHTYLSGFCRLRPDLQGWIGMLIVRDVVARIHGGKMGVWR